MDGFRAAGVNRVSFGVQSFRDAELKRLGRLHSADRAGAAFAEARAAGFDNISLDLMMWLPEQSTGNWSESVDRLIEVGPDHVSLYLLELYPNAPLEGRDGAGGLVAGAGRGRGRDVPGRAGGARRGRVPAVRDFECLPGRAASRATT